MKKTNTLLIILIFAMSCISSIALSQERIGYLAFADISIGAQLNSMKPNCELQTNTIPGRSGGTGTYDDPYLISSAEELAEIATRVNSGTEASSTIFPNGNPGYADQFFRLTEDLDLSDYTPWTPISIPGQMIFYGHLDGDGHTITHLTTDFSTNNSNQGLFSVIGTGASIGNLSIKDSHITGVQYTGAFVGAAGEESEIYNCHNYSNVDATYYYAGGIAGASWGVIEGCTNSGNITSGMDFIGGIVGDFYGIITGCINTGNISGSTSTGGIVGYSANAAIDHCLNAGNIYATSGYSGGVVGFVTNYDSENTTAELLNVGGCYGPSIKAVIGRLWTEGDQPSHANNCYYDCQMTDKTGVTPGNDVEGVVEPRFTHELTGFNMTEVLGHGWLFGDNSYPSPYTSASYNETNFVAIAPAWFRFANETEYDRFDNIRDDFQISNDFYGLSWESTTGKVSFYESLAQLLETGQDTLHISLGDAKKEIIINITDMLGLNETTASNLVAYPNPTNGFLTLEGIEATETQVINVLGQQVMSFKGNEAHMGQLPQGVYLLKSTDTNGFLHQTRLVVSH